MESVPLEIFNIIAMHVCPARLIGVSRRMQALAGRSPWCMGRPSMQLHYAPRLETLIVDMDNQYYSESYDADAALLEACSQKNYTMIDFLYRHMGANFVAYSKYRFMVLPICPGIRITAQNIITWGIYSEHVNPVWMLLYRGGDIPRYLKDIESYLQYNAEFALRIAIMTQNVELFKYLDSIGLIDAVLVDIDLATSLLVMAIANDTTIFIDSLWPRISKYVPSMDVDMYIKTVIRAKQFKYARLMLKLNSSARVERDDGDSDRLREILNYWDATYVPIE